MKVMFRAEIPDDPHTQSPMRIYTKVLTDPTAEEVQDVADQILMAECCRCPAEFEWDNVRIVHEPIIGHSELHLG